jgi:hypothetical protein
MYAKRCYRALDRPLEFFGLEVEDWAALLFGSGALLLLAGPIPGCLAGAAGWIALRRLKSGRPPGYLFYLLYKSGLVHYTPSFFRARGLIAPPPPFARPRRITLDGFYSEKDDESAACRFFRDA